MTDEQHQKWCKDLEELHKLRTENQQLKKALGIIGNGVEMSNALRVVISRASYDSAQKIIEQALKV